MRARARERMQVMDAEVGGGVEEGEEVGCCEGEDGGEGGV